MRDIPDPFREQRRADGVLGLPTDKEVIPMILRHEDVRRAAKDWKTFSSDAPFRVPIPSEEDVRTVRQLPIEVDPPEQTDYRKLVEPFFLRAKQPAFVARVEELTDRLLADALGRDSIEIVEGFALPLQSKALAILLDVPESEADLFISWGIHVFHVADGERGLHKGAALERYLNEQFDRAAENPGDDFYGLLTKASFHGRPLTREEMLGFANLMFAGGRDTVIHSVACAVGYLAERPDALEFLRADPDRIVHASEEFFRAYMPLTHIGRVCPVDTDVHGMQVKAGERATLCWASANLDEEVFEAADEVRLDRKPNPHVSFGFGAHLCLGAAHARTVMRVLLGLLCRRVSRIELISKQDRVEHTPAYDRPLGYDSLVVRMHPLAEA
ncbi:MAG: cytochrome P450 [Planctomycetia bacterium]|nr:cytochrome P450 [Planctomycetia bacterium]